jgi:hypothetical protein
MHTACGSRVFPGRLLGTLLVRENDLADPLASAGGLIFFYNSNPDFHRFWIFFTYPFRRIITESQ